jgi:hypothetical protein
VKDFSLLHIIQTRYGAYPATNPMDIRASYSGRVKWSGHEADQTPPTSAEVKKYVNLHAHKTHAFKA